MAWDTVGIESWYNLSSSLEHQWKWNRVLLVVMSGHQPNQDCPLSPRMYGHLSHEGILDSFSYNDKQHDKRETNVWREEEHWSKGGPLSWGIIKDRQSKTPHCQLGVNFFSFVKLIFMLKISCSWFSAKSIQQIRLICHHIKIHWRVPEYFSTTEASKIRYIRTAVD